MGKILDNFFSHGIFGKIGLEKWEFLKKKIRKLGISVWEKKISNWKMEIPMGIFLEKMENWKFIGIPFFPMGIFGISKEFLEKMLGIFFFPKKFPWNFFGKKNLRWKNHDFLRKKMEKINSKKIP